MGEGISAEAASTLQEGGEVEHVRQKISKSAARRGTAAGDASSSETTDSGDNIEMADADR